MDEADSVALERAVARYRRGKLRRPEFVRHVMQLAGSYDVVTRSMVYTEIEQRVGDTFEWWRA